MFIEYIYQHTDIFLFNSRLFSTSVATLFAFILSMALFPPYIAFLRRLRFSSELENGSSAVPGTHEPVMPAGILFLVVIALTCLLTARFNSYVLSALAIYLFFGVIGAVDDIAKVINKGRLGRGEISKEDYQYKADGISATLRLTLYLLVSVAVAIVAYKYIPNINGHIVIPFLSIEKVFPYFPFWLFIPFMALTIAVMANGVNFTDGFDTLATVPLITCAIFVGVLAYISSNETWATYLLIPHIVGVEEILPVVGAMLGTLLAFLWFNSPPSSIIMGDSGSVGLGGLVGILFIFIKAEFYLPIVGFIFLMEFASDILQIGSFKLTGKRIFLMAPIHHHFQIKMRRKPFYTSESNIKAKITWRFHIISVILLVVGLILFIKVR
jgi:phospho-N-acetylmuramoyl-pentapeptide-transferase